MKLNSMVTLTVELSDELANALAQFVKRVGFAEMRCNAVDDVEAYLIRDAIDRVRMGLANAGFSPR
jgi:predicted transcriptional regulator